ncbi:pyridoxamine 5'-phosphate oxidase [Nocardioides sp. GY 10113]|uniref:pyridoxamine 5'-phosphate oxidase n=1 Tax=Nocardioides sp. GY 10113 TaxID=2569761 RepID=UPI0010A78C1E|nr:pyridoxamine 5'-phosphate oxidase [Nocardioides sp. GY 10113]TIC83268.1 pyridoxamine 5'-phosphate oxidase [Nocardioides sp. GY 10113]
MSIVVDLEDLARALGEHDYGYLLTTAASAEAPGVKVVTVEPTLVDDTLRIVAAGRGSTRNIAANEVVTLTFPPRTYRGYTLIVDGTAEAADGDVVVTPTKAVLHRPADHADGTVPDDGCGHDCAPV